MSSAACVGVTARWCGVIVCQMPPPRALLAELDETAAEQIISQPSPEAQSPEEIAALVQAFLAAHPGASVLEDGKVLFELAAAQYTLTTEGGRCTLQLWSKERNLVRTVAAVTARHGALRLSTERFGHRQTKLLHLVAEAQRSTPAKREPARKAYLRLLTRVLGREFADWQPEGFRAAMDLERSFGPAYIRGSLVRGKEAWAVIGVGAAETQAIIDGVLTLGILWLHHCRERGDGRRLYKGLRVVVPRGAGLLTLARLPWLNTAGAKWELFELEERIEELTERDPADQGNLRTRLIHLPDATAARERFAPAIAHVMTLIPTGEEHRVEQRLRSATELHFLLHGFEFARARVALAPGSFAAVMEITAGHGAAQTSLTPHSREAIVANIAELFRRRDPRAAERPRTLRPGSAARSIGRFTGHAAHARLHAQVQAPGNSSSRLEQRERALSAGADPLFRAAPERWLESALRENLAPLTRSIAPSPHTAVRAAPDQFANDLDPDTRGNRLEPRSLTAQAAWMESRGPATRSSSREKLIPRFDPRFVYTQVPAIAGASDRGMLDLLGVTADGRLAVIELKASDDLQLALQGLDYWIRVRHHHTQGADPVTGTSDLQRHGYFREVELSPLPPRLYLVAPGLHIHPATETVLRYFSPQVEWTLLALDERWRQGVHVVWRKSGGRAG